MKLLLGAIILFLGAVLANQWSSWPPQSASQAEAGGSDSHTTSTSKGAESPLDLLSPPEEREEYSVVVDRPLFLPDRRPPSEEEQEQQEESPPEQAAELDRLDLSAVIITPVKAIAWVRDPAEKELQDLELGDELNGWTVKEILADRLVFERQGETNTLTLRDYQGMHQPPRRQTSPPRAPSERASPGQARNRQAPPKSMPGDRRSARRGREDSQPSMSPGQ